MAPVLMEGWRPAGALLSTFKLIVEFCWFWRVLRREKGGVWCVCVDCLGRFWVLAPPAEMAPQDGLEDGAVSQQQRR